MQSSLIIKESDVGGGYARIYEQHTDNQGKVHYLDYLLTPGEDKEGLLAKHAASLDAALVKIEIDEVLSGT
jgi:hypothetical protein